MRPPVSSLSGLVPSMHLFGAVAVYYRGSFHYSIVQKLFLGKYFPRPPAFQRPLWKRVPPVSPLSGSVPSRHLFGAVAIYYRRSLQYLILQKLLLGKYFPHTPAFHRSLWKCVPPVSPPSGSVPSRHFFGAVPNYYVSPVCDRTEATLGEIFSTNQNVARARSRTGELNVATWNVCSLSLTGRRGASYAEVLLQKCKVLGCDVIGLQETRRPGRTEFAATGYRVFCSGVDGSSGRGGQHGVGLAVKESIIREATWTRELTNERLMSITFNLTGKSNAVPFVVVYGPTYTVSNTREQKDVFWADLESAVSRVPSSDYLFVLIDANARTGVRMGEEDCKVIGAYGRDTRVSDSNGTSLLRFAGDNKLALVNMFFSVPKGCTSRTFNCTRPADRKRIDYIITRQSHRKLVRNVSVHLQPHADSDIVCARVRLPGRFARNQNSEPPQGARVLTVEQLRLTPTDANG